MYSDSFICFFCVVFVQQRSISVQTVYLWVRSNWNNVVVLWQTVGCLFSSHLLLITFPLMSVEFQTATKEAKSALILITPSEEDAPCQKACG